MSKHERIGRAYLVAGMQWGSEGKGSICSYLAPIMSMGIRSGGANAGHTVYYKGRRIVLRQIPSACVNPNAKLAIAIGAIVNAEGLLEEIEALDPILGIKGRLFVDRNAHVITAEHVAREQASGLAERISSCSATMRQGIGATTAAKVMREESCVQAYQVPALRPYLADTVTMINECLEQEAFVLLEGAQGFSLSLEYGQFPKVTSRDTCAMALAASAGIATHEFNTEVIGVTRTLPIRVHGDSGPMGEDAEELTWEQVTKLAGAPEPIIERTSVTQKIRRVATFSIEEFKRACMVNRPTEIALTFGDYIDWNLHGKRRINGKLGDFIDMVEEIAQCPVTIVNTGPTTTNDLDPYRKNILRRIAA